MSGAVTTNGRTLAMHQPNFLPWAGWFHKLANSDTFVILDDVQVPRGRSYASRTRIKTPVGSTWLTLPIKRGGKPVYRDQPMLPASQWYKRVYSTIRHNYARAPHWDYGRFTFFFSWGARVSHSLSAFNCLMIQWAATALNLPWPFGRCLTQSLLGASAYKERLAVQLCQMENCSTYLSGTGAWMYNDPTLFQKAGITLEYNHFECPTYPQLWGEFEPNLSIIDLIFNCGPDSREVLLGN